MDKTNFLFPTLFCILLMSSCKEDYSKTTLALFPNPTELSESECKINNESLAQIEGIICNSSHLTAFDFHSGQSYSLFNIPSGEMIGRFGAIGQGPNEILLGTVGNIEHENFYIFDDQTKYIAKYNIDSLSTNIDSHFVCLAKYKIPGAQFSIITPVNDSIFLGAGTYRSEYQYLLFDKKSNILDYAVEIYNANDSTLNKYHKYLSNQGNLKKRPGKNQFVFSLNLSSNIDFFEVNNNKINLKKSLRLNNPRYKPIEVNGMNQVIRFDDNVIGYIDISATEKYVYALYTDKKVVEDDRENDQNSNIVLVFDWKGNPVKQYKLSQEAYYMTVDEDSNKLYAAIRIDDMGWSIKCYDIE